MKRITKIFKSFLLIFALIFLLVACTKPVEPTEPTEPTVTIPDSTIPTEPEIINPKHLVLFEVDGKIYTFDAVLDNEVLESPVEPTKEFYNFDGWYLENELYDFNKPVVENLVLKGQWTDDNYLTVKYFLDVDEEPYIINKQQIDTKALEPVEPTKIGYNFEGWLLDGNLYDFSEPVTGNLSLIAKFNKAEKLTVTFITEEDVDVPAQEVELRAKASEPEVITYNNKVLKSWKLANSKESFNFNQEITEDIELYAEWVSKEVYADIKDILNNTNFVSGFNNDLPRRGKVNNSRITWTSSSKYISKGGFILPLLAGEEPHQAVITGTFRLGDETVEHDFLVDIKPLKQVDVTRYETVRFQNLTTEYEVKSGNIDLFFEEDGLVPYVKIIDFFNLVEGFIDPNVKFKVVETDNALAIHYEYYDETEDHTYDLIVGIDAVSNTISTNDPGFFWAYVLSTETNYGRHIEYLYEHPNNHSTGSEDVVYDLSKYNLEITKYNGEIVLPLYIVNQLFAGSSYYNVYYNYDGLYGIYALPSEGESEYTTIKTSSKNKTEMSEDLLIHTVNTLAFDMDYFYGLKDILEIETFYDYIFARKDSILTTNSMSFDEALFDILVKDLDEPHTSFGYPSYYNDKDWSGPVITMIGQFGPRLRDWYNKGLYAMDDAIEAKWGREGIAANAWAASSTSRPSYWFLDDKNAVVSFDSFVTADIYENNKHDNSIINKILDIKKDSEVLPEITGGSKYFYINNSTKSTKTLEILIKGLTKSNINSIKNDLTSFGYEHIYADAKEDYKQNGYYKIKVDSNDYFVVIGYDEKTGLTYVGISKEKAPSSYSRDWSLTADFENLIDSDSALYLEFTLEALFKEKSTVENIVLDVTWNMGGNVGALYRVVGFITNEAFKTSRIDRDTSRKSTTHIIVDGVPNYSHINWSLLTSNVTFSAANSLATIFKQNNLGPVIGMRSGGGAASITPILLPNGTAFTMSSNNVNAYISGLGTEEDPYVYHDNEFGISPDYNLSSFYIFNESSLLEILNTHYSNEK